MTLPPAPALTTKSPAEQDDEEEGKHGSSVAAATRRRAVKVERLQRALNDAHVHFERLRGGAADPSSFFTSASPPVRDAVERYNVLIHALEDASRNFSRVADGKTPQSRAVVTLRGRDVYSHRH